MRRKCVYDKNIILIKNIYNVVTPGKHTAVDYMTLLPQNLCICKVIGQSLQIIIIIIIIIIIEFTGIMPFVRLKIFTSPGDLHNVVLTIS